MNVLILWATILLTCAVAAFSLYLLIVTAAAVHFRSRRNHQPSPEWGGKFFIVIPAHDEAALIADTVSSLRSTLAESSFPFSVWVVADNCSDNTAELAAGHGARVLRRTDPLRAGKGYALAFFFDQRHLADGTGCPGTQCLVARQWDVLHGPRFAEGSMASLRLG